MSLRLVLKSVGVAFAFTTAASACASADAYRDDIECGSSTMVLMAQAVPTAQSIPCLAISPDGWSVSTIQIGEDGAMIRFSPQNGDDQWARLDYRSTCLAESATEMTIRGGCVSIGFSADVDEQHRSQLLDGIALLSRQELQDNVRREFIEDAEL